MSLLKFEHPIHCSLDFFLESMQLTTAKKLKDDNSHSHSHSRSIEDLSVGLFVLFQPTLSWLQVLTTNKCFNFHNKGNCALSIGVLQGTMKSLLIQMSFKLCLLLEDGRGSANAILDLGVLGANQPVPKLPVLTRCRTFDKYPTGVGLFPHVDTHSAFEGSIYSLSLLGSCIVEFRASVGVRDTSSPNFVRKAIYLPLQSMILLSGAGRYAWQHYIPHQHQQGTLCKFLAFICIFCDILLLCNNAIIFLEVIVLTRLLINESICFVFYLKRVK
ncbi:putative tRNA (carboxymethyluridine(34)-5-O)-methyltransferase [Helianthus annuus]|uniref:tRNA (Carboxymethyluridine(34)-5-O)-methyltransferase n=1 Tax=Helianthus annuus TaxID=4232 RepID=A0A9K3E9A7_HELAN|nr:putative tRNA (carboxymethyluridine(34)-5-O)-methyltransferase [Helianthus annuus]